MRKINHLAVFALVIFQQILGFVWYSKYLFGYTWMEWLHKKPEDLNPHNPTPFIASILGSFLFCYGLDWLMRKMPGWDHPTHGAILGALVWLLFMTPSLWTHYEFLDISFKVFTIDAGMGLVSALVTGFILGLWKGKAAAVS